MAQARSAITPSAATPAADNHDWRALGEVLIDRLAANTGADRPPGDDEELARFDELLASTNSFAAIAANARLNRGEAIVLAVAAACEMDNRLATAVGLLNGIVPSSQLTLHLVDRLLRGTGHSVASTVGADSQLRRSAFVDVVEEGPWAHHLVVVHPTVIWALAGDEARERELSIDTLVIANPAQPSSDALVVVTGPDRIRRRDEAVQRSAASRLLVVPHPADETWAAVVREATLSGMGVVVELNDTLSPAGRRAITRADHLPWAITSRRELAITDLPNRPWVEFSAPSHDADDDEWQASIGMQDRQRHRLSAEQLDLVGRAYGASHGDLDAAVRRLVAGPLEQLAQRIHPTRTWDDIVLTADRLAQLRGIIDRYRYAATVYDEWGFSAQPSRGLVTLFSGASGTGKTLAAEIVAGELGLDVFKLNLSAVVSKYIGETEKNLEQIFDAAGSGNVVLFFDEADSLFGKRSEVKDSRDRYANIEVSYLLQRLERYDGVVVLATNFEKNVDEAFLRRIHARIEFPVPSSTERRLIWARNFPASAPVNDIDFTFLADQFEMPGGSIRNAAVHAGFEAAAAGEAITMRHAVLGVASEYRKMGRLLKPEHFGPYFDLVGK